MEKDNFKIVLPAEMEKSKDGEWRVRGLASNHATDKQGERIIQKGMDLTPIDSRRGIINWDHGKGPENTLGLLDGYKRQDDGLYVEGRLFKNHSKAKAVKEIMESLGEGDKGRIGMSVEGKILERDPTDPKTIRKCQINAVALTMNPVNTNTYADLVKSMNQADVEFNSTESEEGHDFQGEPTFSASQVMSILQKALSVGSGYTQAPDSRSGGDALAQEDMDAKPKSSEHSDGDEDGKKPKKKKRKMKPMTKTMYKSSLIRVLDNLQTLYPDCSRSQIWEAVKERLNTRFPTNLGKMEDEV
jgi:hypothetical protein